MCIIKRVEQNKEKEEKIIDDYFGYTNESLVNGNVTFIEITSYFCFKMATIQFHNKWLIKIKSAVIITL